MKKKINKDKANEELIRLSENLAKKIFRYSPNACGVCITVFGDYENISKFENRGITIIRE